MRKGDPVVVKPRAACPCPETMTDGIENWRDAASVAALSKIVPDWTTIGTPPLSVLRTPFSSYQRTASRD
jgi:hypothetical protein